MSYTGKYIGGVWHVEGLIGSSVTASDQMTAERVSEALEVMTTLETHGQKITAEGVKNMLDELRDLRALSHQMKNIHESLFRIGEVIKRGRV